MRVANITALFRLTGLLRKEFAARLAQEPWIPDSGAKPPTYGILSVIAAEEPISQREVADLVGLHVSDMVELVDLMERNGWIARTRDPGDRRRYHLTISPEGREVLGRFDEIAAETEAAVLAPLSETERRTLVALAAKAAGGS